MHIGKTKQSFKCTPVSLDHWSSEEMENKDTGKIYFHEKYSGKSVIKDVSEVKYLGNKIS